MAERSTFRQDDEEFLGTASEDVVELFEVPIDPVQRLPSAWRSASSTTEPRRSPARAPM